MMPTCPGEGNRLSLPIQMLISSRITLTDTTIICASFSPTKLTHKINHHRDFDILLTRLFCEKDKIKLSVLYENVLNTVNSVFNTPNCRLRIFVPVLFLLFPTTLPQFTTDKNAFATHSGGREFSFFFHGSLMPCICHWDKSAHCRPASMESLQMHR